MGYVLSFCFCTIIFMKQIFEVMYRVSITLMGQWLATGHHNNIYVTHKGMLVYFEINCPIYGYERR
jgi:hypothetical protein